MKKLLLLLAVAVAFTFTAAAQNMGGQTTTTTKTTTKTKTKKAAGEAKETKAKEVSETGCLAAGSAPDTYTLTKGKKSYTITGMDLSQHVGHEVKVSGDWTTKGKDLKATNVEHIADTCKPAATASKGEKPAKTKSKAKAATPPGF
jgi:hypothetical protein